MLVPKLVSSDAASVAGDVLVLLSGSNGRILAATGTLTTTQRRQLTEAVAAVGGTGPVGIPGSVIGRSGRIVVSAETGAGTSPCDVPSGLPSRYRLRGHRCRGAA